MPTTLLDLPQELLDSIITFLEEPSVIYNCILTSKSFDKKIDRNLLWNAALLKVEQTVEPKTLRHPFFEEAHRVKPKYLGEKHPTFGKYHSRLRKILAKGYTHSFDTVASECRSDPVLSLIVLAILNGAPSSTAAPLKSWLARHNSHTPLLIRQASIVSLETVIYSLQNISTRQHFLKNATVTKFINVLHELGIQHPKSGVGVYVMKNISTFLNEFLPDLSRTIHCDILGKICWRIIHCTRSLENTMYALQNDCIFSAMENKGYALYDISYNHPLVLQNEVMRQKLEQSREKRKQRFGEDEEAFDETLTF